MKTHSVFPVARLVTLFILGSLLSGYASDSEARRLTVGELAVVSVRARCKVNRSQIAVSAGEVYEFRVSPGSRWVDLCIPAGPEGYDNGYMRLFASTKRVSAAKWCALCGRAGDSDEGAFVIGSKLAEYEIPAAGELCFFANDNPHFYWNNFGRMRLCINRIR